MTISEAGSDVMGETKTQRHVRTVRRGVMLALAVTIVSVLGTPPAAGHDPQRAYVYGTYPAGCCITSGPTTLAYFESAFPGRNGGGSSFKDAVLRGSLAWNGQVRTFNFGIEGYAELPTPIPYDQVRDVGSGRNRYCDLRHDDPYTSGYDPRPLSLIYWASLPSSGGAREPLGESTTCQIKDGSGNYRPQSFFLAINRDYTWYRQGSTSVPAGNFDLQSVATHEFGHATGWVYHYDDGPSYLPQGGASCDLSDPGRETMCSGIPPGSAWTRTLGPHDRHTFGAAYPAIQP